MTDPAADKPLPIPLVGMIGFVMGSADLVPGVSGGTVALMAGIYERLVASIRTGAGALSHYLRFDFFAGNKRLARVEWRLLVPLLLGILTAVFVLAGFLSDALDAEPELMSALFFGFVVASTVVAIDELKVPRLEHLFVGLGTAVLTFILLGLRTGTVDDLTLPLAFAGGALAICAMILPGISGSFLLLIVGMYDSVITAVDERDLVLVGAVGLGAAVGLGSFSTGLHWMLARWHDMVLATMLGLMLGSLRVLWPWPAGEDGVGDVGLGAPTGDWAVTIPTAIAGFAVVIVLAQLARRRTTS